MSHNISYFHEKVSNYFILYLWTISYASGIVCIGTCANAVRLSRINLFKTTVILTIVRQSDTILYFQLIWHTHLKIIRRSSRVYVPTFAYKKRKLVYLSMYNLYFEQQNNKLLGIKQD